MYLKKMQDLKLFPMVSCSQKPVILDYFVMSEYAVTQTSVMSYGSASFVISFAIIFAVCSLISNYERLAQPLPFDHC